MVRASAWLAPWILSGLVGCQSSVVPLGDSGPGDAGLSRDAEDGPDGTTEPPDRGLARDSGTEVPDSGPGLRTFTGVLGREFVNTDTFRFEPTDLRAWTISARAGGRRYPGVGRADGTFSIRAPAGELEVEVEPAEDESGYSGPVLLVVTPLDRVDLTYSSIDADRPAAPPGTRLTLEGDFVEPWVERDELRLLLRGTRLRSIELSPGARVGDLNFGPWTLPWVGQPELLGGSEDELLLGRWSNTSTSASGESVLSEIARLPAVDVRDRAPRTFALTRLPTEARPLDYDLSLFDPSQVVPRPYLTGTTIAVSLLPRATALGWKAYPTGIAISGPVALWALRNPPDLAGVLTRNLPAAPPGLETCATAIGLTFMNYPLERGYTAREGGATVLDCRPGWHFPLVLSLGAPRNLRIDGRPARAALPPVGATPTLTWEPPARGRVNGYEVSVIGNARGQPYQERVAWTEHTSLTLPEGWLTPGFLYSVVVTAIDREGGVLARPRQAGFRQQTHAVVSEGFSR